MRATPDGTVAFLFLGEMLLIPHLLPIAEALAARGDIPIEAWVSTSAHEELLANWVRGRDVRVRRAPGFRRVRQASAGANPVLPNKLMLLAGMAPILARRPVAVCAEQTSLWLPALLPLRTRFVKTAHGAGSMSARTDRRRRAAALTLVPSEAEGQGLIANGVDPAKVHVTGYVKSAFRHRTPPTTLFSDKRPILLYAPHWQPHRSSWPHWGRHVVERLVACDGWNIIFAPHQRLVENAPELRAVLGSVAHLPHVHCDLDSFAMVDGSYTAAADIFIGDTSSQVVEFMATPRPCLFLNPQRTAWQGQSSYAQWRCGQVIDDLDLLLPAIAGARALQPAFEPIQRAFAARQLGDTSGRAAERAAALIARLLERVSR